MEEILSSIKRIIAEDADDAVQHTPRERRIRTGRKDSEKSAARETSLEKFQKVDVLPEEEEILELTDEMPRTEKAPEKVAAASPPAEAAAVQSAPASANARAVDAPAADTANADTIVSVESELAARSSLAALSSMIVKPSDGTENTLDGLVRELLKPMLKQWLDANLPTLVEGMVAQEISRITGRPL